MMERIWVGFILSGMLLGSVASAKEGEAVPTFSATERRLSPEDIAFLETLVRNNLIDVALGLNAMQRAENGEVMRNAKGLIRAALLSNEQIMMLLRKKGEAFTIPEVRAPEEVMAELEGKKGKEFDAAYLSALIKKGLVDEKDVESFASKISDPEVKELAARDASMRKTLLAMAARLGKAAGVSNLPPVGEKTLPEEEKRSPHTKTPALPDIPYGM